MYICDPLVARESEVDEKGTVVVSEIFRLVRPRTYK
jgi:hypothetical protein